MQTMRRLVGGLIVGLSLANATAQAGTAEVTATSQRQRTLHLTVAADQFSTSTTSATLCSAPGGNVQAAQLWMPQMGHGSAPTHLTQVNGDCARIDGIDFFMSGKWDIRVSFADGDSATLSVVVRD